jgi:transcriptional regulator with GAF, ATPase, and Fis domain
MLARAESITSVLRSVAETAHRSIPGSCGASLTLVNGDGAACLAYAGQLAKTLDEWQYDVGDGPCLTAANSNDIIEIVDADTESRWPNFTHEAVRRGVSSCLAIPVPVVHEGSAAVTLYGGSPHLFDGRAKQLATRCSSYAAAAMAYAYAEENIRAAYVEELDRALQSSAMVEQAKGILVERHEVTPRQALDVLTRAAMTTGTRLDAIATSLVETGLFDRRYVDEVTQDDPAP